MDFLIMEIGILSTPGALPSLKLFIIKQSLSEVTGAKFGHKLDGVLLKSHVHFGKSAWKKQDFEENSRSRNELSECLGRLGGESGNSESGHSTDPILGIGSTKSTLLQPQGRRSKHLISAVEALEAFIWAVLARKRSFMQSTESCITATHRRNGTAGIILYACSHEEELKPYKDVIKILDEYFVPKVYVPFERHVFRKMEQQNGERVDQFVCRLR